MFIVALFTKAKTETTWMSINRGMVKEDMEYIYSGISFSHFKKTKIMTFTATSKDLAIIILNKVRRTNVAWYPSYVGSNFKNDTSEPVYKTETDLQTENKPMVSPNQKCEGRDKSGAWDKQTHTCMYKIDYQQGPTV